MAATMMTPANALTTVLEATGRTSLEDALIWLAERTPSPGTDLNRLLQALVVLGPKSDDGLKALTAVARRATRSDLDSAAVLFRPESIVSSNRFREALDLVATKCHDKRLASIDANAVQAAQRTNAFVIEALCAVAGLSYGDLQERAPKLPTEPSSDWTTSQVRDAFAVIDDIVSDRVTSTLADTVPTRPLDLMPDVAGSALSGQGWAAVEAYANRGVPYEVLLAQRAAGGTWLAHRNATSSLLSNRIADRLCDALDAAGIDYRRATGVGGDVSPGSIQKLSNSDKQVGLVVLDKAGRAAYAVAFASARDSGTARKSGASLRAMKRNPKVPMAALLSGRGWSQRNETADLAIAFDGRLFSDTSIDALVKDIKNSLAMADPF